MSSARHPPRPAAAEEAEPGQRFGLVAPQLADETFGRAPAGDDDTSAAAASRSAAQPPPTTETPPASGGALDAEREAQRLRARELRRVGAFGERVGRGLEIGLVERDPTPAGTDERAGFAGEARDVGRGELDVVEDRRPAHVGELVRADDRLRRQRRRTRATTAWACAATARARARRSRPLRVAGRWWPSGPTLRPGSG